MSIFEYDKVEEEKKLRKAEFDAGIEQGLKQGVAQGIEQGLKQASTDTALRLLNTGKFDVKEIAELKMPDLNAATIESAMSMVEGTCRSMGVTVTE